MGCSSKVFLILCMLPISIFSQKSVSDGSAEFVEVPREIILPVVAVQPNCPIQFEKISHLAGVNGGSFTGYQLRNVGSKAIRRFIVASSSGAVFEWWRNSGEVVSPGEVVPQISDDQVKVVHITDKLSADLNLKGPMKGIIVLMVVSVEFVDGTKFEDKATYDAMKSFVERVGDALYQKERMGKQGTKKQL